MKKVFLAVIAILYFNFNAAAQNLEQDIAYYKFLNKLWAMSGSFDKVAFHLDNQSVELKQTRKTELETIDKLYAEATAEYALLRPKEYDVEVYNKLGELLIAMEKSLADLKSEQWTSDPMWQYGYNVVKLRLGEMETRKEAIPQLTKNDK